MFFIFSARKSKPRDEDRSSAGSAGFLNPSHETMWTKVSESSSWDRLNFLSFHNKSLELLEGEFFLFWVWHPQYSSFMFSARDGDTRPLLPLLLVTMAAPLPPLPWRPPPPPPLPAGGVGVVVEEAGCCSFFLLILRSLARRFWNQILTWNRWTRVRTSPGPQHDWEYDALMEAAHSNPESIWVWSNLTVYTEETAAKSTGRPAPEHEWMVAYLSLRQTERRGELRLPPDGDVFAVVELLLQLQALVVRVDHPVLVFSSCFSICKHETFRLD